MRKRIGSSSGAPRWRSAAPARSPRPRQARPRWRRSARPSSTPPRIAATRAKGDRGRRSPRRSRPRIFATPRRWRSARRTSGSTPARPRRASRTSPTSRAGKTWARRPTARRCSPAPSPRAARVTRPCRWAPRNARPAPSASRAARTARAPASPARSRRGRSRSARLHGHQRLRGRRGHAQLRGTGWADPVGNRHVSGAGRLRPVHLRRRLPDRRLRRRVRDHARNLPAAEACRRLLHAHGRRCGTGTTCAAATSTCVVYPSVGQSCAGDDNVANRCLDGICDPSGKCARYGKRGDPCEAAFQTCGVGMVSCDATTLRCEPTCTPGNGCGAGGQMCCAGRRCNAGVGVQRRRVRVASGACRGGSRTERARIVGARAV